MKGLTKYRFLIRFLTGISLLLLPLDMYPQNCFQPGEELTMQIYFGPVNAGLVEAHLEKVIFEGKELYHARALARTTGLADRLYKVRDIYEGYFDSLSLLPIKSVRDISEGRYKKYDEVMYDHESGKAYSIKSGEHDVPADIMDMATAFYFIRNIDYDTMSHGQIIDIDTFFDDEVFPFDMRYYGKEELKTRGGTFKCIKLVPFVEPGRIFESEDDMTIWISDDANHVPVRVRFNLIVGAIKCDLIGYSGLKY